MVNLTWNAMEFWSPFIEAIPEEILWFFGITSIIGLVWFIKDNMFK